MAAINVAKQSGVLTVLTAGQTIPKSFYGEKGYFQQNASNDGFLIQIGSASFQISLADLRINGVTPSTMQTASTLLTSLFGS